MEKKASHLHHKIFLIYPKQFDSIQPGILCITTMDCSAFSSKYLIVGSIESYLRTMRFRQAIVAVVGVDIE